jgi:hypothetical protein
MITRTRRSLVVIVPVRPRSTTRSRTNIARYMITPRTTISNRLTSGVNALTTSKPRMTTPHLLVRQA